MKSKKYFPFIPIQIPLEEPIKIENGHSNCGISMIIKRIRPNWTLDHCEIEVFTNGITNKIFCVSNREEKEDKLIFRVFGAGSDKIIDRFENGLVYGYLPGECVSIKSVREPSIVEKICISLSSIHKIPLTKEEQNQQPLFQIKSKKWIETLPNKISSKNGQILFDEYFKILFDKSKNKINFIDYEYAGPNPQLYDIANHLNEYAGVDEIPNYEINGPKNNEREYFLKCYFLHFLGKSLDNFELKKLIKQLFVFECSNLSKIQFDYMQYAISRHKQFILIFNKFDEVEK
uniref:ethanolamine kinase n=1 Tax=Meloidogyne hapla TaxID=6305 RepID=A0A1I8BHM0_MELHA